MEHKSEENGKVSNFLAGTVPDGVKPLYMTASRVTKEVDMMVLMEVCLMLVEVEV